MRRMIRTAMVLLALLAGLPAAAQAPFPEPGRPVTVIVPYPPGGGSDVTARPGARAGARPRHFRRRDQPARRGLADRHGGTRPLQAGRLHPGLGLWPSTFTLYLDPSRHAPFTATASCRSPCM